MPRSPVWGGLCICAALWWLFSRFTDPWAFPRFVVGAVVLLYLPGRGLMGPLRQRLDRFEAATLAWVLGMVATSAVFAALAASGLRHLMPLWPAVFLATFARSAWHSRAKPRAERQAVPYLAGVPVLAAWVVLALAPLYYRNLAPQQDGGLTYYPLPDLLFHLSIANELTHTFPPQAPFLPGRLLDYHYGQDLLVALFSTETGTSVPDLTVRFVPTLLFAMAGLAAFAFARSWLGSLRGGALAALLVFFGEDLSFVLGWLSGDQGSWPIDFFAVPTSVSLFMLNPMLPALALQFSALLCLQRHAEGRGRGFGLLAALLVAAVFEYKVFAATQLLAALAVAGVVRLWRFRDRSLLAVALTALFAAFVLTAATRGQGGAHAEVRFLASPLVSSALVRAGLWETWLGREVKTFWTGSGVWRDGTLAFFGIGLPAFLLGSFGARVLAVGPLVRELRSPGRSGGLRLALCLFVLLGPAIGLALTITPASYPPEGRHNEALWFFVQSKYLAWLFALEPVVQLWRRSQPPSRALMLAALLAVSLPGAVQHVAFVAREPMQRLEPDEMAALAALERSATPGDVVLANPRLARAVIGLTPYRAPGFDLFTLFYQPLEERRESAGELDMFFADWQRGVWREDVARRHAAAFVLVDARRDGSPFCCRRLFENDAVRLYALPRPSGR